MLQEQQNCLEVTVLGYKEKSQKFEDSQETQGVYELCLE
jgi:hypothetical protein